MAFFNLRLGWVFSGLVVPGYMVPLLLIKPWSAAVVFLDGFIVYFLVNSLSEGPSRLPYWCSVFGRDRFFALLLVSVIVRLVVDGWLIPLAGESMNARFGWNIDYRNDLHSFGLIIIALIANNFWKTGFRHGLWPLCVTVSVTYLIIRYGLMELTNFSVGSLVFLYEDLAASILASPKAYIILLTTAFVASRMNLFYGWDYNGILIPSLLALQWYQPAKILTTFVEAFLILAIARFVLQLPMFTRVNMEGARKVLLFFNIGFVLKLGLGYLLPQFWPDLKVTDTYGFGYLLATLIAARMHDQDLIGRLTRATLQTSLTAVIVASVGGFLLASIGQTQSWLTTASEIPKVRITRLADVGLYERLQRDKVALYQLDPAQLTPSALPNEATAFRSALRELVSYQSDKNPARLDRAASALNQLDYELLLINERYAYLSDRTPARGRGLYVLDVDAQTKLTLEAPAPLDEPGTAEAARALFKTLGASSLAVAGTWRNARLDGSTNVLQNRQTLFQIFHKIVGRGNTLQVRDRDAIKGRSRKLHPVDGVSERGNMLWISGTLPPDLDLVRLRNQIENLQVRWESPPFRNVQRDSSTRGFAELALTPVDLRRVSSQETLVDRDIKLEVRDHRIDGYLLGWLLGSKQDIAGSATDLYREPRFDELIYFDEEVVSPLLSVRVSEYRNGHWTRDGLSVLRSIDAAASAFGYELIRYRHRRTEQDYLILAERPDAPDRRYWGTYVFRLGTSGPFVVQIPRPGFETNSLEFGTVLFEQLNASALLIAGARPDANRDGSADLIQMRNMKSTFTLVNQVLMREAGAAEMLTIQTRALGSQAAAGLPGVDALLAFNDGIYSRDQANRLTTDFLDQLAADQLTIQFVDGSPQTAGYEVGFVPQLRYLEATVNKIFATLWLSPHARASYQQQDEDRALAIQFRALDIPTIEADLHAHLANDVVYDVTHPLDPGLSTMFERYVETQDSVTLNRLKAEWPRHHWMRLIDIDSRQAFMLVFDDRQSLRAVVNLRPRQPKKTVTVSTIPVPAAALERFIATRAGKLVFATSQ